MAERKLNGFVWLMGIAASLGGGSLACSKEEPRAASAATVEQAQVFRFAPPDGTEYVRTDRRTEELSIVGAPLRQLDTEELRWRARVRREGGEYRITQDLTYLSFTRDGETLVEGEVPQGISATLFIGQRGNLERVGGLEQTAEILRSLVAPESQAEAEEIITADALSDLVAARYRILFADTIGRPAAPGSSWTITNPPGSFVKSRKVSVTGHEACGMANCARLRVDFQLDPKVLANAAVEMVRSSMAAAGEDPSQVAVRSASYTMSGWMLVEPATMLSHGASLTEGGSITTVDADQDEVTVLIKGTTDLSYSYAEGRTSKR